jgi:hypothetical protein
MEGFFETAKMSAFPKKRNVATWEEAQAWARREPISIVPEREQEATV